MAERIGFIYDSDSKKVLISRVIGRDIDRNKISIEEKISVPSLSEICRLMTETTFLALRKKTSF